MGDFLNMSEEDIKLKFITPSIMDKGWGYDNISMEKMVKFTDGKINLRGNLFSRSKAKYADYMLYYNKATPIAIVEAKDATHSISYGMQQAKEYAMMMNIPFAYSSNGQGFQEYDFLTGKERRERTGSWRLHNWLLAYQAILASSSSSIIILDLTYYYKNYSLSK